MELCRVVSGVRTVVANAERMPRVLEKPVTELGERLAPHWMLGDAADVVSAYTEGNGPAIKAAIDKSRSAAVRWQLQEIWRCLLLADKNNLIPNDPIEPVKMWK